MPPPNQPTWDALTTHVPRPRRHTPRHRAEPRRWADLRALTAHALTAARTGLRDAWYGTDTPVEGLALLASRRPEGPMPS